MSEERTNCLEPSGSGEWWMSGWTRLYDKIKATDGFYTNGELMNKQAYVFLRMAKIVVNHNIEDSRAKGVG